MIPQYKGFEKKKFSGAREILPAGGYVGKILKAEVMQYPWGNQLEIKFDIVEGEFKDFFLRDWNNNTNEDRKWRGVLKLKLPTEDGSKQDGWKINSMNNLAASLEESNSGYTWDWDETKFKGKLLGFLVREFEWSMNGNFGVSTEASSCTDIERIRNGKFKIPKMRKLKEEQNTASAQSQDNITDPDDLPF